MSTAAVPQPEELDVVQHPSLGELKFPHSMPIDERNASIERLEANAAKQDLPGGTQRLKAAAANNPAVLGQTQPTKFEKDRDPKNQPGIMSSMGSEVGSIVKSIPSMAGSFLDPMAPATQAIQTGMKIATEDERRKQSGRSGAYRAVAAAGTPLGINAAKMEDQADVGNARGIIGTAAGDAAPYVAPAVAAPVIRGAGRAMQPAVRGIGERLYQSALKPSTTLAPGQRAGIIRTGLDRAIPVSEAGLDKVHKDIQDVNASVDSAIASNPNATVNPNKVASRLNDTTKRFSNQVAPTGDLEAVGRVGNDFLENHGGKQIPAVDAQNLKKGTYRAIGSRAYGEVKGAQIESEKALARGIKEELETQFPEIKGLNAQESKLYALEPVLSRAIGRISNHQLLGIGTPIVAGSAAAITGSAKAGGILGAMKAVIDNPAVKSRVAIMLNKAGKGAIPLSDAHARVAGYAAGLGKRQSDEE